MKRKAATSTTGMTGVSTSIFAFQIPKLCCCMACMLLVSLLSNVSSCRSKQGDINDAVKQFERILPSGLEVEIIKRSGVARVVMVVGVRSRDEKALVLKSFKKSVVPKLQDGEKIKIFILSRYLLIDNEEVEANADIDCGEYEFDSNGKCFERLPLGEAGAPRN